MLERPSVKVEDILKRVEELEKQQKKQQPQQQQQQQQKRQQQKAKATQRQQQKQQQMQQQKHDKLLKKVEKQLSDARIKEEKQARKSAAKAVCTTYDRDEHINQFKSEFQRLWDLEATAKADAAAAAAAASSKKKLLPEEINNAKIKEFISDINKDLFLKHRPIKNFLGKAFAAEAFRLDSLVFRLLLQGQQQQQLLLDTNVPTTFLAASSWTIGCPAPFRPWTMKPFDEFGRHNAFNVASKNRSNAMYVDYQCAEFSESASKVPTPTASLLLSNSETETQPVPIPPYRSPARQLAENVNTAGTIMALSGGPGQAGMGARSRQALATIGKIGLGDCGVDTDDFPQPVSSSPLQLALGSGGGFNAGITVGNAIFLVLVWGVSLLAFVVRHKFFPSTLPQQQVNDGDDTTPTNKKNNNTRSTSHKKSRKSNHQQQLDFKEIVIRSASVMAVILFSMLLFCPVLDAAVTLVFAPWAAVRWKVVSAVIAVGMTGFIGFAFFFIVYGGVNNRQVLEKYTPSDDYKQAQLFAQLCGGGEEQQDKEAGDDGSNRNKKKKLSSCAAQVHPTHQEEEVRRQPL